jgi:hypothetical protein
MAMMRKYNFSKLITQSLVCLSLISFLSVSFANNFSQQVDNGVKVSFGVQAAGCTALTIECFNEKIEGKTRAEIDKLLATAKAKATNITNKTPEQIATDELAASVLEKAIEMNRPKSVVPANSGLDVIGQFYYDSPKDLLPAYRWNNFPFNVTPEGGLAGGALTQTKSIPSNLASIGFKIANVIWAIVLWLIDFAGSSNLILSMGQLIDNGYYAVATTFLGDDYRTNPVNSLIFILMVFVFYTLFKRVLKGDNLMEVFRMVMTFFIVVSVMYFLATTTEGGDDSNNICNSQNIGNESKCVAYVPTKFTPAWIAYEGTTTLNNIAGAIVTAPQIVKQVNSQDLMLPDKNSNLYSCEKYVGYLYDSYAKVGESKESQGIRVDSDGTTLSAQASMLWQRAFLMLWSQANFGSASEGALQASCHYLEYHNGTTPQEQIQIGKIYGNDLSPSVYLQTKDSAEQGYGMYPWMACQSEKINPAWEMLFAYSENANTEGSCASWRKNGPDKNFLHFSGVADVDKAYTCALINLKGASTFGDAGVLYECPTAVGTIDKSFIESSTAAKDLTDIRGTIMTYRGSDVLTRPTLGLASLVSAIGMGFVLGIVSLGALAATFGLILMLIWLPVTLILIANDSRRGKDAKGSPMGMKMLKFTISFMASKVVLMFAILIIIQLSVLIITAIDTLGV